MVIAAVPACKRTSSSDEPTSPETTKVSENQADNKVKVTDINAENSNKTVPANSEEAKADDDSASIYLDIIDAETKNADEIDRCFEEFAVNFFKTQSESSTLLYHSEMNESFDINIDTDGKVTEVITKFPYKERKELEECLSNLIKTFRFNTEVPKKNTYAFLKYRNDIQILDLRFDNTIRLCFEKYYMDRPLSSEDRFNFIWKIDKTGKAKDIQYQTSDERKPEDFSELTHCIENTLTQISFNPTVTQLDVPIYTSFGTPYYYDMIDFDDEKEKAFEACLPKAKSNVKSHFYGFKWVINPDGSVTDVSSADSLLDQAVGNCYVDIIKQMQFKPTLTGNKIHMYYEYKIGNED